MTIHEKVEEARNALSDSSKGGGSRRSTALAQLIGAAESVRVTVEQIRNSDPAYWTNTIVADTFEIALAKGLGTEI